MDARAAAVRWAETWQRAAVEWWASLVEEGREITLAGTSVLRFGPDGLVIEQRDTWNQADGRSEPPGGGGGQPGYRDS